MWLAALGCIIVGIAIVWILEVGSSHVQSRLPSTSNSESFTTISIVMLATALLKGN